MGITIDMHSGKPTRKFGTRLTDTPLQLGYVSPYVVTLHQNFLEVHNPSINNGLCQVPSASSAAVASRSP